MAVKGLLEGKKRVGVATVEEDSEAYTHTQSVCAVQIKLDTRYRTLQS
jgi:hypothetical protein